MDPKEHWKSKAAELKKERKFEESVGFLDKVKGIQNSKNSENYWYKKACDLYEIGEYDKAKDALLKDLEVNKKNYETLFLLAKILFELKSYEESLEYLNKASEDHDSKLLKNIQKIDQMKNLRKFEEAVKYSDKVKQDNPLDHSYWYQRGMVFFKLRKFTDALSCFNSALELKQEHQNTLYQLAKTELYAGNKEKSFEILERICTIEPNNKEKLRLDSDFKHVLNDKYFKRIFSSLNSE